jgi:hypothetical protein
LGVELQGVISTSLGFVLFGGVKISFLNISGIMLNTGGGVRYAYLKYLNKLNALHDQQKDSENESLVLQVGEGNLPSARARIPNPTPNHRSG